MWRLFISDLRNRWLDWVGIILVAFFCGRSISHADGAAKRKRWKSSFSS